MGKNYFDIFWQQVIIFLTVEIFNANKFISDKNFFNTNINFFFLYVHVQIVLFVGQILNANNFKIISFFCVFV